MDWPVVILPLLMPSRIYIMPKRVNQSTIPNCYTTWPVNKWPLTAVEQSSEFYGLIASITQLAHKAACVSEQGCRTDLVRVCIGPLALQKDKFFVLGLSKAS